MNLSPCTCVQPKSVSRPSLHACQFGTAHPREPLRLEQLSACYPFWKMTSNLEDFMLLLSCSFCKQPTKHKHCFPRRILNGGSVIGCGSFLSKLQKQVFFCIYLIFLKLFFQLTMATTSSSLKGLELEALEAGRGEEAMLEVLLRCVWNGGSRRKSPFEV